MADFERKSAIVVHVTGVARTTLIINKVSQSHHLVVRAIYPPRDLAGTKDYSYSRRTPR